MELPESLQLHADKPADIERVAGFIQWTHEEIARYHAKMGFAMSVADLVFCRDYFRDTEKRDPAVTELKVIDTYWSDHCRHTTFLTQLDTVDIEKVRWHAPLNPPGSNMLSPVQRFIRSVKRT